MWVTTAWSAESRVSSASQRNRALVGYMRVSTDGDRQVLDLQRDALLAAGVDERHLFGDRASGSRDDRAGLARALAFVHPGDCLVCQWRLHSGSPALPVLWVAVAG